MPAIGITGGIATGKTTLCDCLREIVLDAKFFNADEAARELRERDPQVKEELRREFGLEVFSSAGDLNREALRAIILQSGGKKRALEQILHPRIRRQWSAEAQAYRNSSDFFFADIPLLYETGGETICDRVVVVACSPDIQRRRLRERGSIDERGADEMINAQMPLEEKIKRANHVVWNNGEKSALQEQATMLVKLWQTK